MPILSNLNVNPYNDDFDTQKNFYQILSKPGFPLQAREFTQAQSILGNQLEELASSFYKNGDIITNGGYYLSNPVDYVRTTSITQGSRAKDFIGYELKGVVSGVVAEVIYAEDEDDESDTTFYVSYISSGVDSEYETFVEGETLESNTPNNYTATVGITTKSKPVETPVVGFGSLFTINEGSIYVNGKIVRVDSQTISLCKYSTKPSFEIGLVVDEDFVTSNEDPSLLDNAQGHSNFAAPGADRLRITLHLSKKKSDSELPNFIKLVTLLQGNVIGSPTQDVKWQWLTDLLAKRTYDAEGNFTIDEFAVKPLSYWNSLPESLKDFYFTVNDEEVDGVYEPEPDIFGDNTPYPPVPDTIVYESATIEGDTGCGYLPDRGAIGDPLTFLQADAKYALLVDPGSAYVQGYHVGYVNPFYVYGNKPREKFLKDDTRTQVNPGTFCIVNNTYNAPNIENIDNVIETRAFDDIECYRNFTDGFTGGSFKLDLVGNNTDDQGRDILDSQPQNLGNKPWITYHIITNQVVDIKYDQNQDGTYPDQFINIIRDDGSSVNCHLVYPGPELSVKAMDGYLLTDPIAEFRLVTEDGDALRTQGTAATQQVVNTNSLVVALKEGDELEKIIRGDAISDSSGIFDELPKALIAQRIDPILAGVVHPKYYYPNTPINKENTGFFGYNSSYNMGILSSYYFTELVIADDPETGQEEWSVGTDLSIVYGSRSGARAKLEQARRGYLVVSNIYGQFIPGEQIYQYTGFSDDEVIVKALLRETGENITTNPDESRLILDEKLSTRSSVKRGRIIRDGEVVQMKFNSRIGTLAANEIPGGGGDKELAGNVFNNILNIIINPDIPPTYTDDVLLRNPMGALRQMGVRLPEELGDTQMDANFWFYYSIKSLELGFDANNTFIGPEAPENPDFEDMWVNTNNYVLYVRDRHMDEENLTAIDTWVAVTPGDPDPAVPMAVVRLAEEVEQSRQLALGVTQTATSTRNDYDLSINDRVLVYATGSTLELKRNIRGEDDDFTWNSDLNTLEFTEAGREKIYKFSFFNPDRSADLPRVNYEIATYPSKYEGTAKVNDYVVRGYATSSPAFIYNSIKKTKAFHSDGFSTTNTGAIDKYSADADLSGAATAEIHDLANGALFSGTRGTNYVSCDNFSGDASNELISGDVVSFANDSGSFEYKIVSFVTKPYGYGQKRTKCTIYFTTTIENSVFSKVAQRLRLKNYGKTTESLVYQLPVSVVSSLETNQNVTGINYSVFREFVTDQLSSNGLNGNSSITFTTDESNATFISDSLRCTVVVVDDKDNQLKIDGRNIALDQIVPIEISDGGRVIKLNLGAKLPANAIIKAILPVRVTNAKSKRKNIIRDKEILVDVTEDPIKLETINLGVADVYRLQSVMMETETDVFKDITENYVFDDGQRDTYYDYSRIIKKEGRPGHTGKLKITYDYFEHKHGDGEDFFSVDSYTHDNGIPYGDIPAYYPQNTVSENQTTDENPNNVIKLRDCVDFRPVINTLDRLSESGEYSYDLLADYNIPTSDIFNYHTTDVSGNAHVGNIPIPTTQFISDIEYYLPKIDSMFLDKTGKMVLQEGEPSENPVRPDDMATGIRLYDLFVPAYTFDVDDIEIKKYNYRRYTMKDIMDIDKRVERVETLVSLSILEQSALNMNVRDAVTGLDRFKNGIVVDPFTDHSKGEISAKQYRCAIDPKESHLRAPYVMSQVELEEINQTDLERERLGNYVINNNIVTSPFNNVRYIDQPMATRSIDVQSSSSQTFEGVIHLSPAVDTFYDTSKPPKMVIDTSSIYSASLRLTDSQKQSAMGTVWTEWETGVQIVNDRVNQLGIEHKNKRIGPMESATREYTSGTVEIASNTLAVNRARNHTNSGHSAATTTVQDTAYGKRLFDIQLSHTMRSIPVYFKAERLKPNTRYYAFFDDINVSEWVCVDKIFDDYTDGLKRYNGAPNSEPAGFGQSLISDDEGNISGVFIVPNGRSPVAGTIFTGNLEDVEYNKSGKSRTFTTGKRAFKLSTNISSRVNATYIKGYAKTDFISRSVMVDKTDNIVSTRNIEYTTNTTLNEDVRFKFDGNNNSDYDPSGVPAPVNTPFDPLAQTFIVDRNFPEGVFVSELDVFFRQKDLYQGVEAYLVSTEGGVPTNRIVPHSRVVKASNSTIRVVCELRSSITRTFIASGTIIRGAKSGASGVVKDDVQFDSASVNPTENTENNVYNVVLSNYNGDFLPGEDLQIDVNPVNQNKFSIANNEITITRIDITNMGENYDSTSVVEISEPDLPGGINATATCVVAKTGGVDGIKGQVYEIILTNSGSGYTKVPTVTIKNAGTKATAVARITEGRRSVVMGVATSDDATQATTFKFKAPVYLMGNKTYAFVIKSPSTMMYKLWCSKIGENKIGTMSKVTTQPNMGVLFTSQNSGMWTEDQTLDIKFNLRRCQFQTNVGTGSSVKMQNKRYSSRIINIDPIETFEVEDNTNTSGLFRKDPSIVKVRHYNHGLVEGDFVVIEGVDENPGGIPNATINGLHQVINADLDEFTIKVDAIATKTAKSGGSMVSCTYNKPYETINLYSGLMAFPTSTLRALNRPTQHAGLPSVPVVEDTLLTYNATYKAYNEEQAYTLDEPTEIPIMDTHYYPGAKQIANYLNEVKYSDELHMRNQKSMVSEVQFSTSDDRVSPVIDLDRTNMTIVHNMVDKQYKFDKVYNYNNRARAVNSNIDVDFYDLNEFRTEEFNDGSSYAKWLSKLFVFENECDGIEVKLSAIFYELDDIKVYYKTRNVGIDGDFQKTQWTPFNPGASLPNEQRKRVETETGPTLVPKYTLDKNQPHLTAGLADNIDRIKSRNSFNIDPRNIMSREWQELTYSSQDIPSFDACAIKIVFNASNPALVPLIDDLRIAVSE